MSLFWKKNHSEAYTLCKLTLLFNISSRGPLVTVLLFPKSLDYFACCLVLISDSYTSDSFDSTLNKSTRQANFS